MIASATVGKRVPNAEDELDAVEYARFIGIVKSSRDKLLEWSKMRRLGKAGAADIFIGGHEGLSYHLEIARIDEDGDGKLTHAEYNEFSEHSEKSIDKSFQMLLNSGVVGTLLLSFLYPMAFTDLQPSDEAAELLGDSGCMAVKYIFYLLLHATLFQALTIVFLSVRFYVYLGYWLIDMESKLVFLAANPMVILAVLDMFVMNFAVVLLIPGSSLAVSPYVGCIAAFYVLLFFAYICPHLDGRFGKLASELLDADAEAYVGKIIDIRNHARASKSEGKFDASNPMRARSSGLIMQAHARADTGRHGMQHGAQQEVVHAMAAAGSGRLEAPHKQGQSGYP